VLAVQIRSRVIDRGDREVQMAVDIEQHGLDHCLSAGQEQVLGVRPPAARPHPDPAAARDPHAVDDDVVGFR